MIRPANTRPRQPAQQRKNWSWSQLGRLCFNLAFIWVVLGCPSSVLGSPGGNPGGQPSQQSSAPGKPEGRVAAAIQTIRREGYPTNLAELDAWYVMPPAAQNAAPLYAQALAAIAETNPASPLFVTKNQQALAYLHQAATRSQCRYAVDLTRAGLTPLPHLVQIKLAAQLLQHEAVTNATKGQADLAGESILAGLSLTRSLEREPCLISQLVRLAGTDLTITGLELTLNRTALREEVAARLSSVLQEAEDNSRGAMVRGLVGERCLGIAIFASPALMDQLLSSAPEPGEQPQPGQDYYLASFWKTYRTTPAFEEDQAYYLERIGRLITAVQTSWAASLALARTWRQGLSYSVMPPTHAYSAILLPALGKALQRSAVALAELRAARVVVAVERYRLAHKNALPQTLSQLVPGYLKSVPTDPFDNRPLRFKRQSSRAYIVYSIGPDGVDNGGLHKPAKVYSGMNYDLALAISR